jgi:predicted small metal-binding protein
VLPIGVVDDQVAEDPMKQFACGDVVPGCDARWVCSTDEEILAEVAAHARVAHDVTEVSPELIAAVRGSIVAVG